MIVTGGRSARLRVAAVGDLHLRANHAGRFRRQFVGLGERADLLLLAGDLTQHGTLAEARVVAGEVADLPVPVVAVLGNHDLYAGCASRVAKVLTDAGVTVLDNHAAQLWCAGLRVGIAGGVGWPGGFGAGDDAVPVEQVDRFTAALGSLRGDVRIVLTHYSPTLQTLQGEPDELHAQLGSRILGQVVDSAQPDLVVHGHAHHGREDGRTSGGVQVRNVARPVIRADVRVYGFTATPSPPIAFPRLAGEVGRWWLHRSSDVVSSVARPLLPQRDGPTHAGTGR